MRRGRTLLRLASLGVLAASLGGGCVRSDVSPGVARPVAREGKRGAGLRLRFERDASAAPGGAVSVVLRVEGAPGQRLEVRWLDGGGVAVPRDLEISDLALDAEGRGTVRGIVKPTRAEGALLVAQVTTEAGRTQEASLRLGAASSARKRARPRAGESRGVVRVPSG